MMMMIMTIIMLFKWLSYDILYEKPIVIIPTIMPIMPTIMPIMPIMIMPTITIMPITILPLLLPL